jgi:hypothetical protein
MTKGHRQERLQAVATAAEGLAASAAMLAEELRKLAMEDNGDRGDGGDSGGGDGKEANATPRPERRKVSKDSAVAVGRRVKVVILGPYRGRVGVVVSRKGTMYWYVQLDETERDVSRLIYKMSSSLKVIEE